MVIKINPIAKSLYGKEFGHKIIPDKRNKKKEQEDKKETNYNDNDCV